MNGFINMNKPAGMSSAAVVGTLKRLTGVRRIGHAGTLDLEAAGVLPLMLGRATRLFDYLVDKEKEYEAVCSFGTATDTQDATGRIVAEGTDYPDAETVIKNLPALCGDILQKPSAYSAIKLCGKPLYARARSGENVEAPERTVHVERIEMIGEAPEHAFRLRITCGKGTYIRSICDDLGKLCGCPAHMRSLTRTKAGFFVIADALTVAEAKEMSPEELAGKMVSLDSPLQHLSRMEAPEWMQKAVGAGAKLPVDKMFGAAPEDGGITRVYLRGRFFGIAERDGDMLRWRVQIPEE